MTWKIDKRHTAIWEPSPSAQFIYPLHRLDGMEAGTFQPYDTFFPVLLRFDSSAAIKWATNACTNLSYTKYVNPRRSGTFGGRAFSVSSFNTVPGVYPNDAAYSVIETSAGIFAIVLHNYTVTNAEYTGEGTPPHSTLDGGGDRFESGFRLFKLDKETGSVLALSDRDEPGQAMGEYTQMFKAADGGVYTISYGNFYTWNSWDTDCHIRASTHSAVGGPPPHFPSDYDWTAMQFYSRREVFNGFERPTYVYDLLDEEFNVVSGGTYPADPNDRLGAYTGFIKNGVVHLWGGPRRNIDPPIPTGKLRYYQQQCSDASFTYQDVPHPLWGTPWWGKGSYFFDRWRSRFVYYHGPTTNDGVTDTDDREIWTWGMDGAIQSKWHVPRELVDEDKRVEGLPGFGSSVHDVYVIGTLENGDIVLDTCGMSAGRGLGIPGGLQDAAVRGDGAYSGAVYLTAGEDDFRLCRAAPDAENPVVYTDDDQGNLTFGVGGLGGSFLALNLNGGSSPVFGL